jgi:AcrR family transcriptional regulator
VTADRPRARALKREAVRLAAARLFARRGYHNVSLDDIARELHVTKPTIYYYVGNKEALLAECFIVGLEQLDRAFASLGEHASGRDRLVAYLRSYGAIMATDAGRCTARIQDGELGPRGRQRIGRLKSEVDRQIRNLIRLGIADGSIARIDPRMAAFALAGSLNWIGHWFDDRGDLPIGTVLDRFIALFLDGLRPRGRRPASSRSSLPRPSPARRPRPSRP